MNSEIIEQKKQLRETARHFRKNLDQNLEKAEIAALNFFDAFKLSSHDILALYFPVGNELDTLPLAERAWAKEIKIALPAIEPHSKILTFREWIIDSKLIVGKHKIPAPAESAPSILPTHILVPLLMFDQRGVRLGMGGGYYDATLKALRRANPQLKAIGYAYSEQAVLLPLPQESHDEKLDFVVTPQKIFAF